MLKFHRDEENETYKKNFNVLKNFFFSLFKNETEEELFEKLSKFPFYEKRLLKETMIKKIFPIDEEIRYIFPEKEKEIYAKTSFKKISFYFFAKNLLFQSIESFFGYSKDQIRSKTRELPIIKIRSVIAALYYKIYRNESQKVSLEKIAKITNRDHTSIMHEAKSHNSFIEQNKFYLEEFVKFLVFFFSMFKDGEEIIKEIMTDPIVYSDKEKKQLKALLNSLIKNH